MNKFFVSELLKLEGKIIKNIKTGEQEGYMLFQFHIEDKLLCMEIAKGNEFLGGRCFLMNDNQIDGAGVFPL